MSHRPAIVSMILLLAGGALVAPPALAQWSTDPSNNLLVADQPLSQSLPKIVPTPDGGFYVAWLKDFQQSDVYLQKLDAAGNEVLAHNGILAIDRTFSGSGDFALASDADGNAILVGECCDAAEPSNHIAVFKYAPDGSPLFGPDGITVSTGNPVFGGSVAITSDGNLVAQWQQLDGIHTQKLDPAGNPLWGPDGVITAEPDADTFFGNPRLVAGDAGSVIFAFTSSDFTLPSGNIRVLAQKLSGVGGAPFWGTQPIVVSAPVDNVFDTPAIDADASGGAVVAWSELYDPATFAYTVKVQHIDATGAALLADGGVEAGNTAGRTRFFEHAFFDAGSRDIYVQWLGQDATGPTPSQGIYTQRLDAGGALRFGLSGKLVSTYDPVGRDAANLLPAPGGALVQWVEGDFGSARVIRTVRLDDQGNSMFPGGFVDIKTAPTNVNQVAATVGRNGYAAFAWAEDELGQFEDDIHAQNLQFDGTLGGSGEIIFANGFE